MKGKLKYDIKYTADQGADPITILFTLSNIGIELLLEDGYTKLQHPYKTKIHPVGMEIMNYIDSDNGFSNLMNIGKLVSEKSKISSLISKIPSVFSKKKGGAISFIGTSQIEAAGNQTANLFNKSVAWAEKNGEALEIGSTTIETISDINTVVKPIINGIDNWMTSSPDWLITLLEFVGISTGGVVGTLAIIPIIIGILFASYQILKMSRDIYMFIINLVGVAIFNEIDRKKQNLRNKLKIIHNGLRELNFTRDNKKNTRYPKGAPYSIRGNNYEKWNNVLISLPGKLNIYEYRDFIVDSYSIDNTNNHSLINVIVLEHKFKKPQLVYIPKKYNSFFEQPYKSDVKVCIYENIYCKIYANITKKLRPDIPTSLKSKLIRGTKRATGLKKSKLIPGMSPKTLNRYNTERYKNSTGFAKLGERISNSLSSGINLKEDENVELLAKDIIKSCNLRNCNSENKYIDKYIKKQKIDLEEYGGRDTLEKKIKEILGRLKPKLMQISRGGNTESNKIKKIKKDIINKMKKETFYYDYTTEVESIYFYVNEDMLLTKEKQTPNPPEARIGNKIISVSCEDGDTLINKVVKILNEYKKKEQSSSTFNLNITSKKMLNDKVREKVLKQRQDILPLNKIPCIPIPTECCDVNNKWKGELWKLVQYLITPIEIYKKNHNNDNLQYFIENFRKIKDRVRIHILNNIPSPPSIANLDFETEIRTRIRGIIHEYNDTTPQSEKNVNDDNDIYNKLAFLYDTCILVKNDKKEWNAYDSRMYYVTQNNNNFDRTYDDLWMKKVTCSIPKIYIYTDQSPGYKVDKVDKVNKMCISSQKHDSVPPKNQPTQEESTTFKSILCDITKDWGNIIGTTTD